MHNNDDPLPHATTAVDPRALEDRHLACPHLAVGHAPAITTCVVHRGRSCRVETDVFTNERNTPSDRPRPRPSPNPHPHADTTPDRPSYHHHAPSHFHTQLFRASWFFRAWTDPNTLPQRMHVRFAFPGPRQPASCLAKLGTIICSPHLRHMPTG